MNRSFLPMMAIFGALLLGLVLVTNALTSGANTVGQFAKYALVASFFVGLLAQKASLYLLIVMTGYLDMLKRVMIIDTRVSFLDLYYVLGMAPILLAGVTCGLMIKNAAPENWHRGEWKLFWICSFLFVLMGMGQLAGGLNPGAVGKLANSGAYLYLLFAVGCLVRDARELRKLLLFTIGVFVPVALYTLWQSKVGLAGFEHDYLMSGLSIESRQFGERIFRPFSTMNAAGNLSMMMGSMAVASLYVGFGYLGKLSLLKRAVLFALVPLFMYAAYLTYSRGGWVCGIAALVAVIMFGSRIGIVVFYGSGLTAAAVVAAFAGSWIKDDAMATFTDEMLGSSTSDEDFMVKKVTTFTDRLISVDMTLRDGRRWRPFGLKAAGIEAGNQRGGNLDYGPYFVHDGFSYMLLKFGYIPLAIVMVVGTTIVVKAHRQILLLEKEKRKMALLCGGLFFGLGVGFSANSAQLTTFPINFYVYLFASFVIVLLKTRASVAVEAESRAGVPVEAAGSPIQVPVG